MKKYVILQASHALIDINKIDQEVLPSFLEEAFKPLVDSGQFRMPDQDDISKLSYNQFVPLNIAVEHLIYQQDESYFLESSHDDAFKDICNRYKDAWYDYLNSGDAISDSAIKMVQSLQAKGYEVKILLDLPGTRDGALSKILASTKLCYSKIYGAKSDFSYISLSGLNNIVIQKRFPSITLPCHMSLVTNNASLMSNGVDSKGVFVISPQYFSRTVNAGMPFGFDDGAVQIADTLDRLEFFIDINSADVAPRLPNPFEDGSPGF